jgi:hypothetical protein
MKTIGGLALLVALLAVVLGVWHRSTADRATENERAEPYSGAGQPVLVELFTSEGCSSCPPADELLANLQQQQPVEGAEIITLSEHVDYWNHLGWADPFSRAQFSERQTAYAMQFGGNSIYTPQMIVDGRDQFVGSDVSAARDSIAKAARRSKALVAIELQKTKPIDPPVIQVTITINNLDGNSKEVADVFLAVAESGLRSSVQRGENKGRNLTHTSVVRKLELMGTVDPNANSTFTARQRVTLDHSWNREQLRAVVFAQSRRDLRVIGVSSTDLGRSIIGN